MNTLLNWIAGPGIPASDGTRSEMAGGGMPREHGCSPTRRWRLFGATRLGHSLALGLAFAPVALPAQSNFVVNGSFEFGTTGWQFTGASYVTDQGPGAGYRAAAGSNCAQVLDPVFQDLATMRRSTMWMGSPGWPGRRSRPRSTRGHRRTRSGRWGAGNTSTAAGGWASSPGFG